MGKKSGQTKQGKNYLQCPSNLEELKKLLEVDTLPGSKTNQEIFLLWVQQKLQEEGGLEFLQENKNSLLEELGKKVDLDIEYQAHAERARLSGFIHLGYLCSIFAYEERYSAILPRLWNFFQVWDHLRFRWKRMEIQTETYQDRAGVWFWIFRKMAGIDKHLCKRAIIIPYLPLRDSETKKIKEEGPGRSDKDIVKLDDLKEYIENISKKLNIDFPLPPLLFPEAQEEKKEVTDEADKSILNDYEHFVRNLRVWYENDSEIKIQEPGKPAKELPCESLGFRDNRTREWKTLLEILQNKNHCYCVGLAHTKEYDQNRNILKQINIKLVKSFSKIFNIQIPRNFQFYELDQSEKPGTYRFKFQIKDNDGNIDKKTLSKYYGYKEEKLLSRIKILHKEYRKNPSDPVLKEDFIDVLKVAFEKKLKTKDEVRDMLETYADHFEGSLE